MSNYITLKQVVSHYLMSNMCNKKNGNCIKRMKRMDKCLWFTYMGVRQKRHSYHVQHRIRFQRPFLIPIWNPNGEPKEYFKAFQT